MYAVPAYYLPHQDRKNLTVLVSTLVTSVDLEAQGDKLTATGVRVVSAGREHVVHVIKEVILAAG
jgi:acetate kinase